VSRDEAPRLNTGAFFCANFLVSKLGALMTCVQFCSDHPEQPPIFSGARMEALYGPWLPT
jgi:hypothetical protein